MKKAFKKTKLYIAIVAIGISSFVSYSFVDSYFEVSKNLDIFATLFRELNIYYVDETNPGEMMKTGIDAMLNSLDPYTNYIPESDIEDYRFMTTGQYGGIGALIRTANEYVMIAEPYENFPAQKAGLKAGDLILEVDGKSAVGKNSSEMSEILKGQPGTEIILKIKRPNTGEVFEKTLAREEIKIDDVPYQGMIEEGVGYIKLNSFTATASKQLIGAMKELEEKNTMKGLVIDLRGNGGGLLREAVNIVNAFVEKGQEVVSTRGKIKDWDKTYRALSAPVDTELPLVILVDGGSASASEIVAGAIQDLDRGIIVGQKTFGKGLVQQTRALSYNSQLKVTVAKYYIPSGRCIQKIDYSHKNERGKAEKIPDSLITAFETQNGRKVYDGAGLYPDIDVPIEPASNIAISLVSKNHIFDFATDYYYAHENIAAADDFELTEEEYKSFVQFLEGKDYEYTTRSERLLEDFEEAAEDDKYYEDVQEQYEALKAAMKHNKEEDLFTFKEELKGLLENEIVSRYYYQKGRIQNSLANDPEVKKAIEVIKNGEKYNSILAGTFEEEEVEEKN